MCPFWKQGKIVRSYMGETSYASVTRRAETSNQDNKYRALINKLIILDTSNRPKLLAPQ